MLRMFRKCLQCTEKLSTNALKVQIAQNMLIEYSKNICKMLKNPHKMLKKGSANALIGHKIPRMVRNAEKYQVNI